MRLTDRPVSGVVKLKRARAGVGRAMGCLRILLVLLALLLALACRSPSANAASATDKPNILLMFPVSGAHQGQQFMHGIIHCTIAVCVDS